MLGFWIAADVIWSKNWKKKKKKIELELTMFGQKTIDKPCVHWVKSATIQHTARYFTPHFFQSRTYKKTIPTS